MFLECMGMAVPRYTLIYTNRVFMTIYECEIKAEHAYKLGIIRLDQIDDYAKHLYEKYNGVKYENSK